MSMIASAPRFSVIIPNFNNGATLARAIDSVLGQSYSAHEIIVVDDGSEDDSRLVVERYGCLVHYVFQENAGVAAARNRGVDAATGNWLAFLDADDCYFANRLEAHARWIHREPSIPFLFGDQEFRDPTGRLLRLTLGQHPMVKEFVSRSGGRAEVAITQADFECLIADGLVEIRTLSVPKETFLRLGGFPVGTRIGEDLHFVIRLCAASKTGGFVNQPLAAYYIYPESALRRDPLEAQQRFVEALEALSAEMRLATKEVRRGYLEKLRQARLSLAYTYLRQNRRMDAARSVLPTVQANPGVRALHDLFSVIRGMPR